MLHVLYKSLLNCCRNEKTYLAIGKSSLTPLLLSKCHDFACDAVLTWAHNFQSAEQSRPTSTSKEPSSIPWITLINPFESDFARDNQHCFYWSSSVESWNRIPCVALNRHTIPFALFFIWLSLARAIENYLWMQQLQYNCNAQWISSKGTWKAWAGNPDFRQFAGKTITTVRPASQRLEKQKMTYPFIPFLTYFASYFAFPISSPLIFLFNCKFHPALLRK